MTHRRPKILQVHSNRWPFSPQPIVVFGFYGLLFNTQGLGLREKAKIQQFRV